MVWRARAEGLSDRELARRLGLARKTVLEVIADRGGIAPQRPLSEQPGV